MTIIKEVATGFQEVDNHHAKIMYVIPYLDATLPKTLKPWFRDNPGLRVILIYTFSRESAAGNGLVAKFVETNETLFETQSRSVQEIQKLTNFFKTH